jgi:hypothetical protein
MYTDKKISFNKPTQCFPAVVSRFRREISEQTHKSVKTPLKISNIPRNIAEIFGPPNEVSWRYCVFLYSGL